MYPALKSSLLPPRAVLSLGGSSVCVSRLTTEQTLRLLPILIALVDTVADASGDLSIGAVIQQHEAGVLQIASVSTGLKVGAIAKLKSSEFTDLIEALLTVNADFLHRAEIVARKPAGATEGAEPTPDEPMTVDKAAVFIERLVNDLRAAGVCSKREALENTLADNLALFDALSRKEARDQLASIDALQGVIAAAFSEEAGKAVQRQCAKLTEAAGFGPALTYTWDNQIHL